MCEQKQRWTEISELRKLVIQETKELARNINLVNGTVRVTINESRAVKIEASQYVRICCQRLKHGIWEKVADDLSLVMNVAPQYVSNHMERLIVDLVGAHGYVEGVLKDRNVTDLFAHVSVRPTNKNPKKEEPSENHLHETKHPR